MVLATRDSASRYGVAWGSVTCLMVPAAAIARESHMTRWGEEAETGGRRVVDGVCVGKRVARGE